jgi:hypothetical protein
LFFVYFIFFLQISPCTGWLNSNETVRNLTTEVVLFLRQNFSANYLPLQVQVHYGIFINQNNREGILSFLWQSKFTPIWPSRCILNPMVNWTRGRFTYDILTTGSIFLMVFWPRGQFFVIVFWTPPLISTKREEFIIP